MVSHAGYAPARRLQSAAVLPFFRLLVRIGAALLGGFCLGGPGADHAAAQAPSPTYYMEFAEFYDGDYRSALERFTRKAAAAIKTAQSRWIDSICYETMVGECYYEMGHLEQAWTITRRPSSSTWPSPTG